MSSVYIGRFSVRASCEFGREKLGSLVVLFLDCANPNTSFGQRFAKEICHSHGTCSGAVTSAHIFAAAILFQGAVWVPIPFDG